MSTSAWELLILPVLLATVGSIACGAAGLLLARAAFAVSLLVRHGIRPIGRAAQRIGRPTVAYRFRPGH